MSIYQTCFLNLETLDTLWYDFSCDEFTFSHKTNHILQEEKTSEKKLQRSVISQFDITSPKRAASAVKLQPELLYKESGGRCIEYAPDNFLKMVGHKKILTFNKGGEVNEMKINTVDSWGRWNNKHLKSNNKYFFTADGVFKIEGDKLTQINEFGKESNILGKLKYDMNGQKNTYCRR